MKRRCYPNKSVAKSGARERCAKAGEIFDNVKLIEGENWQDIPFVNDDAKSSAVLIVAKTEPDPFQGFYVRRWDHPYEPNFETCTYDLLEFCQQVKIRKFFELGRAGNLIVWTRDESTSVPYFIGAYEAVTKFRKVRGRVDSRWKTRTALLAAEAHVLPYAKRIPMKNFEEVFRKEHFRFPSEERTLPFDSCYGQKDLMSRDLTESLLSVIRRNAVGNVAYRRIGELHTQKMQEIQRERGREILRFRKRFVTASDLNSSKGNAAL